MNKREANRDQRRMVRAFTICLAALVFVVAGNPPWGSFGAWGLVRGVALLGVCLVTLFAGESTGRMRLVVLAVLVASALVLVWSVAVGAGPLLGDVVLVVLCLTVLVLLLGGHHRRSEAAVVAPSDDEDKVIAWGETALGSVLFQGAIYAVFGLVAVAIGDALFHQRSLWLGARQAVLGGVIFVIVVRLFSRVEGFVSELNRVFSDERSRLYNLGREWVVEDDPVRDRSPYTKGILDALDLRPGLRVADVGTGGGYFAMKIAEAVGPTGFVTATDISGDFVARLRLQAQKRGLRNVEARLVDKECPLPMSERLDRILVANVYLFSMADEVQARTWLGQFASALDPGGTLVVCNQFVHEKGWVASPDWPPLEASQPDAATVVAWASPWCELAASTAVPSSQPPGEHESPGYIVVLRRLGGA